MKPPTMSPRDLLDQLRALGIEERAALAEGRLEVLPEIVERRSLIWAELDAALPVATTASADLREAILTLREETASSLVLLYALREEVAARLGAGRDMGRATQQYLTAGAL